MDITMLKEVGVLQLDKIDRVLKANNATLLENFNTIIEFEYFEMRIKAAIEIPPGWLEKGKAIINTYNLNDEDNPKEFKTKFSFDSTQKIFKITPDGRSIEISNVQFPVEYFSILRNEIANEFGIKFKPEKS